MKSRTLIRPRLLQMLFLYSEYTFVTGRTVIYVTCIIGLVMIFAIGTSSDVQTGLVGI